MLGTSASWIYFFKTQIKSNQIKSNQIKSNQIMNFGEASGYISQPGQDIQKKHLYRKIGELNIHLPIFPCIWSYKHVRTPSNFFWWP